MFGLSGDFDPTSQLFFPEHYFTFNLNFCSFKKNLVLINYHTNQLQFQDYEMYLAGATAAQNHYYNPYSQYTAGPGGHQHYYDEAGHPQYGRTSRGKRRGRKENAPSDAELDKTYTGLDR